MSGTLEDWRENGWLREHETSPEQIGDLLAVVDRDLAACQTPGLHNDWRFNIAYNAALQIATAALAIAGYRAERSNHHYRVIDSLSLTLGTTAATVRLFDTFRKKRNISDYEQADTISDTEANEMRRLAERLRADLRYWIDRCHPAHRL